MEDISKRHEIGQVDNVSEIIPVGENGLQGTAFRHKDGSRFAVWIDVVDLEIERPERQLLNRFRPRGDRTIRPGAKTMTSGL